MRTRLSLRSTSVMASFLVRDILLVAMSCEVSQYDLEVLCC